MYFSCHPHFLVDIAFTSVGIEACILHHSDYLIGQWIKNARELLQDECSTPLLGGSRQTPQHTSFDFVQRFSCSIPLLTAAVHHSLPSAKGG